MARTFDGTDDTIRTSVGGAAFNGDAVAHSFAAILRRTSQDEENSIFWTTTSSGTVPEWGAYFNDDNTLYCHSDPNDTFASTQTFTTADGWIIVGYSMTANTVSARSHKYVYSTNTWTHEAMGDIGNGTGGTPTEVEIGTYPGGGIPFQGDMDILGIWQRELSDAEFERLVGPMLTWLATNPGYLAPMDQSSTGQLVRDIVGNGVQTAITGTTVATSSVPIFNVGGSVIVATRDAAGGGDLTLEPSVATVTFNGNTHATAAVIAPSNATATFQGNSHAALAAISPQVATATFNGNTHGTAQSISPEVGTATFNGNEHQAGDILSLTPSVATATYQGNTHASGQVLGASQGTTTYQGTTHDFFMGLSLAAAALVTFAGKLVTYTGAEGTSIVGSVLHLWRRRRIRL